MQGHAEKCVERYSEFAKKNVSSPQQAATPCMDDRLTPPEDYETIGEDVFLSEMLVLGKNWTTRFTMVSKHSGTISDKIEQHS